MQIRARGLPEDRRVSLAEAEPETRAEFERLAAAQRQTTVDVTGLTETVRRLAERTDTTAGWAAAWLVAKHLPGGRCSHRPNGFQAASPACGSTS